jgi:hypothetical protein
LANQAQRRDGAVLAAEEQADLDGAVSEQFCNVAHASVKGQLLL